MTIFSIIHATHGTNVCAIDNYNNKLKVRVSDLLVPYKAAPCDQPIELLDGARPQCHRQSTTSTSKRGTDNRTESDQ